MNFCPICKKQTFNALLCENCQSHVDESISFIETEYSPRTTRDYEQTYEKLWKLSLRQKNPYSQMEDFCELFALGEHEKKYKNQKVIIEKAYHDISNLTPSFGRKFIILLREKNLLPIQLPPILNIPYEKIEKWEMNKSLPALKDLIILADFFNVSIDYLLNRQTKQDKAITQEEKKLLQIYNALLPAQKRMIDITLKTFSQYSENTEIEKIQTKN